MAQMNTDLAFAELSLAKAKLRFKAISEVPCLPFSLKRFARSEGKDICAAAQRRSVASVASVAHLPYLHRPSISLIDTEAGRPDRSMPFSPAVRSITDPEPAWASVSA